MSGEQDKGPNEFTLDSSDALCRYIFYLLVTSENQSTLQLFQKSDLDRLTRDMNLTF